MGLAMTDLVTVRRRTLASDSQGGSTETWSTQAIRPGRLEARNRTGPEDDVDGRTTSLTQWRVLCEYGADLLPRDRVQVGGVEYEVTAVTTGTEYLAVEADLRRLACDWT